MDYYSTVYRVGPLYQAHLVNPDDIVILIDPPSLAIAHVALDIKCLRSRLMDAWPGTLAIHGNRAKLLFEAAAGRRFDQWPHEACWTTAADARRKVIGQGADPIDYIVDMVIERHYPRGYFDRWLGVTQLDDGKIINE